MTPSERNDITREIEAIICEKLKNTEPLDGYFIRTFLSIDLARGVLCGEGGNVNSAHTIDAVSQWQDMINVMISQTCQSTMDVLDMVSQMIDYLLSVTQNVKNWGWRDKEREETKCKM